MDINQKIVSIDHLSHGPATILCHGVFDVLHAGHLAYFHSAKRYGKRLVVSVTSDRYVNKGPGRPYFPSFVRAQMLAALDVVDLVVINDSPTAIPIIEKLKPSFYVKGPDYKNKAQDITGEIYNEERAVETNGGRLAFTEDETFSASHILNRFFIGWSDEQLRVIDYIKRLGGEGAVLGAIDSLSRLNVTVIGEPITDTYRFCSPEGLSSKSPSISARFGYEENYQGGAIAIERHLKELVNSVRFIEPEMPVPQKIRYISIDKAQRIFEVTHLPHDNWEMKEPQRFVDRMLTSCKESEVAIVADFGHGLFKGPVLNALWDISPKCFVGLNVQTNSSNFGFNLIRKHRRFEYLAMDLRELRLNSHDREGNPDTLAQDLNRLVNRPIALTLGAGGASLYLKHVKHHSPAFSDVVIDATGAGDAFFALSTCLTKMQVDPVIVLFLSNVFAGLKTKIIGNKFPVTKASLVKAVTAILK